jgi:hypothetical protein
VGVAVNEAYRDYSGPTWVRPATIELLDAVDPRYLARLGAVVLTDVGALTGTRKRGKTWSRARKVPLNRCLGLYHAATRTEEAWVEVFVDQVMTLAPSWVWHIPFLREAMLSKTLYHELGHHIHKTQAPEYREREDVADDRAERLAWAMGRRRYPVLMFVLRVLWWPWLMLKRIRKRVVGRQSRATVNPNGAT